MNAPHVTLIGAGNMGGALLAAMLATGRDPASVTVVEKNAARAQDLTQRLGVATTDDEKVGVAKAGLVVLGVKPHQVRDVLICVREHLRPDAGVVSMAAGVTLAQMAQVLGEVPVLRIMPNTPVSVGQGVTAVAAGPTAGAFVDVVKELLRAAGLVIEVAEAELHAVVGVSGSGSAYVFYLIDALAEAGVGLGLPRETALQMAIGTFAGAAQLAATSGTHPAILREQVSSPGGTTVAAVAALDEAGVRAGIVKAARAAAQRSRDMARE